MAALTTAGRVKGFLNIKGGADDALIESLITAVTARITRYLGRPSLLSAAFDLKMDGNNKQLLKLDYYPITAVSAVYVNDILLPLTSVAIEKSRFVRLVNGYHFSVGQLNVRLVGTAGYAQDAIPEDLEQACVELTALRYKEKNRLGETSKSLAGESVSFLKEEMPETVKGYLAPYRNLLP